MPDNHFENKVKQTLDELNFTPSEAVWQKVEKQIKKEDDRMRFLLWLPLLCLFLGGAIWFLLPEKTRSVRVNASTAAASTTTATLTEKDRPQAISGGSPAVDEQSGADRSKAENTDPTLMVTKKAGTIGGKSGSIVDTAQQAGKKSGSNTAQNAARIRTIPLTKENNKADRSAVVTENSKPSETALGADSEIQKSTAMKGDARSSGKGAHSATDSVDEKKSGLLKTKMADSLKASAAKKPAPSHKNKIQWAVYGNGGISSFFLKSPSNPLAYSAPAPVGSYSGPGGGYPSQRASFAFQLGLALQKNLTKTTSVTAGIGFTHAAVSIKRGRLINQPAAFYSANSAPQMIYNYYAAAAPQSGKYNYTQHYDFIEIPVGIEKRISPQSRFSLNAGVSMGWLVSTNALQYDQQSGIYYQNNSYFNKTQLDISGGFQYRILQRGAFVLKAGPQVQYGLTGLLNSKSPYKEHLFLGGFRLVLISNRK